MFAGMTNPLCDAVDAGRVVALARRICAVPAPTFAESARADLVAQLLAEAGAAPERDGAGNVIAAFGDGPPGDAVVFAAHLDTVFAAETEIRFVESEGRLAAPGLGDNSLAVAALVELARGLAARPRRRRVVLAATVGEEGLGDLRGAKALVETQPCGAFVAVEGMSLDAITVAAVGSVRLRVVVRGPGGHPWGDRGTPSAVHGLVGPLARIAAEIPEPDLVANVGVLRGGTVINAIAGEAVAEIDVRCEDDARLQEAARRVRAAFEAVAPPLTVEIEALGHRPGGHIAPDHPLLAAAHRARERAGLPPAVQDASSTDANAAHGRGIPAITVGVTTGANAHRLDEYIDLEPVAAGMASLHALVDELA